MYHLTRGGSINLTIDGVGYTYGSIISLGTTDNSYFCIYLLSARKTGTIEDELFFTMVMRGNQFNPATAIWKKLT